MLPAGMAVAQYGDRLSRIMIAVVKEKDDLATDFTLEFSRGRNLGVEKPLGEKTTRLLSETDDRRAH